jgi:hypothetical protein
MKALLLALLLTVGVLAAGSVERYAAGGAANRQKLAQSRQEYLTASARGPFKSVHLRYRDEKAGKPRTFLFSAQSYKLTDGTTSYVLVLGEVGPQSMNYLVSAATMTLRTNQGDGEQDAYTGVYEAIDRYIVQNKLEKQLQP